MREGWLNGLAPRIHKGEKFIVFNQGVSEYRKMARERVKECIDRLESLRGIAEEEETVVAFSDSIKNEFEVQCKLMKASDQYAGEKIDGLKSDLQSLMVDYQNAVRSMRAKIAILKKAVAKCPSTVSGALPKVSVPKPKGFGGARMRRNWKTSYGTRSSSLRLLMCLMMKRCP